MPAPCVGKRDKVAIRQKLEDVRGLLYKATVTAEKQ